MSGESKPKHLGDIARSLREGSGLTRRVFSEAVGLSEAVLKAFELGKLRLGVAPLQRILRHPIMRDLPKLAAAAGIEPNPVSGPTGSGGKP